MSETTKVRLVSHAPSFKIVVYNNSTAFIFMQNSEIYEDKVELENIIKLSAKEKLQLERQLVQQPQVNIVISQPHFHRDLHLAPPSQNSSVY